MTAVHLDEHARAGHPLTALTVLGWSTAARATQAGRPEDAGDGGLGEREVVAFGQELTEVRVVDARVDSLGEMDDPGADRVRHAAGRWAPAVSMDQRFGAAPTNGSAKAPDLTGGETEEVSRFGHEQLAAVQGLEDNELLLCPLCQCNHASLCSIW
jgi:hypothetical protein